MRHWLLGYRLDGLFCFGGTLCPWFRGRSRPDTTSQTHSIVVVGCEGGFRYVVFALYSPMAICCQFLTCSLMPRGTSAGPVRILLNEGGNHPNRHTFGKCDFRSKGEATEAGNLRPLATSLNDVMRSAMCCTVLDSWLHRDIFGLRWR